MLAAFRLFASFSPLFASARKTKVANMEGREWEILNSHLASFLVDFASRRIANPNESQIEKLGAFKRLCGF